MASRDGATGKLIERLTIEDNVPDALAVSSITRAVTTATVTTSAAHGYTSGDYVTIAGALPTGYNGKVRVTVTGASSFAYQVSSGLTSPATGIITATYASDAQGNVKAGWETFTDGVPAEAIPISADERLAAAAIPALATRTQYRFRIATRADLTEQMRVRWVPRWPPNSAEHVMEIVGIQREGNGRRWMLLDCVE